MQLWLARNSSGELKGIGLSEIRTYPQLKECLTLAATGEDYELWEHLILQIEEWGRQRGCYISKCVTRPGWKKTLHKRGYEMTHIVMEKVIGHVY